jgi:NAD(P)H-dependent flavin oxidoreductase YrpB (nitropropane dioxygenase family)
VKKNGKNILSILIPPYYNINISLLRSLYYIKTMPTKNRISSPICDMLSIDHPILLAGMNGVAGPELAAAVTNAGGLGVIGGVGYTPKFLRETIADLKEDLVDKNGSFGIDLLLPQVGGSARKTNYDYTGGKLPELIDIICGSGCKLFVSAVGVPPRWAVDKLHAAGIACMNMIGSTRHVKKALDAGMDIICAQGTEGGGHTGDTATSVLIPQVVDLCKGKKSELTGGPVHVIAAGGIFDGRGLAMGLSLGASAVWVGTRFINSEESGAPPRHQQGVVNATSESTHRSLVYTGRPMRILKNRYSVNWEEKRRDEMESLLAAGTLPMYHDQNALKEGKMPEGFSTPEDMMEARPLLMGQAAGAIKEKDLLPAADIVDSMIDQCVETLKYNNGRISRL